MPTKTKALRKQEKKQGRESVLMKSEIDEDLLDDDDELAPNPQIHLEERTAFTTSSKFSAVRHVLFS